MGSILKASCPCGFASGEFPAGGGMRNFRTFCAAPAICLTCRKFLVVNLLDKEHPCPHCKSAVTVYDDSSVQAEPKGPQQQEGAVFSWNLDDRGQFRLPMSKYLCPKCGGKTMTFQHVCCWD